MAGDLKRYLDAGKRQSRLLGPIERHILTRPPEPRATDVLHPSEICASDWCHRESWYLLKGHKAKKERVGLRLQSIFDEGHQIHSKWQGYLAEMKVLYGLWECPCCGSDMGMAGDWNICKQAKYAEVPISSQKHKMRGHADGWIKGLGDDCLIEIKSVGIGTVRVEAPRLLAEADGDLDKLWANIKRPFAKHIRQGQLYLAIAGEQYSYAPDEIVFLYEFKPTQATREFVVKKNTAIVQDILDAAVMISRASNTDTPPSCNHGGCAKCESYE